MHIYLWFVMCFSLTRLYLKQCRLKGYINVGVDDYQSFPIFIGNYKKLNNNQYVRYDKICFNWRIVSRVKKHYLNVSTFYYFISDFTLTIWAESSTGSGSEALDSSSSPGCTVNRLSRKTPIVYNSQNYLDFLSIYQTYFDL